jgi:putative hydrolase
MYGKMVVDTHVHTIASGHAYSTLSDYLKIAKERGIALFCLTDHGPAMPGASTIFHIGNQTVIPRTIDGIEVLRGVEANIIDFQGSIDVESRLAEHLDFIIASFHPPVIEPGTVEENTKAYLAAMASGVVDAIGHPGNPQVPVDFEALVEGAKKHNVLIEINNSSFSSFSRKGSWDRCQEIARLCAEKGVRVMFGSDSHIAYDLGNFGDALTVAERAGIPEDMIVNRSVEAFKGFLRERGRSLD